MERLGKVRKGDGKDVDHKDHNTGNNSLSNLQVQSASKNRKDGGPGATMRKTLTNPPKKRKGKKKK